MGFSTTYLAVIVNTLSFILPHLGITIGSEELTTTIQTVVTIATGLWILIQRKGFGGVTALGFRK